MLSVASTTGIITNALTDLSGGVLTIIGGVIGIGVAYLVFKFGWRKVRGAVK